MESRQLFVNEQILLKEIGEDEVENIFKQISKELKHYNLKNKISYKKFLNE